MTPAERDPLGGEVSGVGGDGAPTSELGIVDPRPADRSRTVLLGVIWTIGVLSYLAAVVGRTSLAGLGVTAADRFHLDPITLSLFPVFQLAMYALCQIPVGMLLDRWGTRPVIVVGMVLMVVSHTLTAVAPNEGLAILARALLGIGDATVFPVLLRVIGVRFPRRTAPIAVQVAGSIGQLGQIISVVPFAALVKQLGWQPGFLLLAGVVGVIGVLGAIALTEPAHARVATPLSLRSIGAVWAHPAARAGFWTHAGTVFSINAFGLLWGAPFLATVAGLDAAGVAACFVVIAIAAIVAGPLAGLASSLLPRRRTEAMLGLVGAMAVCWALVILVPPPVPLPLVLLTLVVTSAGGPVSAVGFDFVREGLPHAQLSRGTGLVNTAGFTTSFVVTGLIGLVLALLGSTGTHYTADAFRVAECVQFPVWALCAWQLVRATRALRRAA